ncbi:hypothetical protein [Actinomadura verrucosospora]|uniref:Uncharacterized protein n=1 Tax=Actinomadura verrucosospora TaxID=46165 RepID=A0A7D3VXJ6_ACTVE|nr:hypothetical protein [Actinomadura verrucosospora]QKG23354.1 hypothetical protein ACTIVE_4997 [Actinomadura verrucosospora]
MPKLTDYARKGYNRRRRPWESAELPEWWDAAVWVAGGGIVVVLVLSALLGGGGGRTSSASGDSGARPYPVQTLGSRPTEGTGASPSPGGTGSAAPPVPAGEQVKDFTATAAVQVPVTGGGTTVVPAGARNVALAAARATATGDWSGIPFSGTGRPTRPATGAAGRPARQAAVSRLTVADPAVTGNSEYRFSATITGAGGAQPSVVPITVERDESGYAVRVGP